jgi:8-oxo-dGTP pyrophosphatase MutT (NUDIX family)
LLGERHYIFNFGGFHPVKMTSSAPTVREFSSGGIVLRWMHGQWCVAVIEPTHEEKKILALPKGTIDPGESAAFTAEREIEEEAGIKVTPVSKLGDVNYFYIRTWGGRERVFKVVSFFLFLYKSGRIGKIKPEMRKEVRHALWIPLEEASKRLAYKGEKEMAKKAVEYVNKHPELVPARK